MKTFFNSACILLSNKRLRSNYQKNYPGTEGRWITQGDKRKMIQF